MPIPLTSPTSQPAATFSAAWFPSVQIVAPSPTAIAQAQVTLCPYDPMTGIMHLPSAKRFVINDLFGAASQDATYGPAITAATAALLTALQSYASAKGLL